MTDDVDTEEFYDMIHARSNKDISVKEMNALRTKTIEWFKFPIDLVTDDPTKGPPKGIYSWKSFDWYYTIENHGDSHTLVYAGPHSYYNRPKDPAYHRIDLTPDQVCRCKVCLKTSIGRVFDAYAYLALAEKLKNRAQTAYDTKVQTIPNPEKETKNLDEATREYNEALAIVVKNEPDAMRIQSLIEELYVPERMTPVELDAYFDVCEYLYRIGFMGVC